MKPLVFASKQTWINGCSLFIPPKMLLKGWIHSQMALFAGGQADLPGASSDFGTPAGNPWVLRCFTPQLWPCENRDLMVINQVMDWGYMGYPIFRQSPSRIGDPGRSW